MRSADRCTSTSHVAGRTCAFTWFLAALVVGEEPILEWLLTMGTREGRVRGLIALLLLVLTGCVTDPPPQPVAATPLPPPRSKPPPAPPKVVWVRIDGQHGPEVTQQTEVDLATCKALAETLAAQLQQEDSFKQNVQACMGQHGYKAPALGSPTGRPAASAT